MFTEAQKVDIRRFCGYQAYGAGPSGFQGWRFFQAYGTLEFKLNNLDPAEETVITTIYLANLYTLESAIPASGTNLDTDEAAVWKHNRREVEDRIRIFDHWRRELCRFLGVPPGDGLEGHNALPLVL
jgi:hypothetical protein